jgi:hypothetical protein
MGSFRLGRGKRRSAGATLRFFVISPFMGDFAYRLNVVAAVDYAGSCAGAREHASDDTFEEAVVSTTPNGFVLGWCNGVLVFVCVELAAAEWPKKRT